MNRKVHVGLLVIALLVLGVSNSLAGQPVGTDFQGNGNPWQYAEDCVNIQSGDLKTSDGYDIAIGFDQWGYNYQGRMFSGNLCDAYYEDSEWCESFGGIDLLMEWNDQWLSNESCDDDNLLDIHRGFPSYIGSGAWVTNQMTGEYVLDGDTCQLSSFSKIVAVPADAYLGEDENGLEVWYTAGGEVIGQNVMDEFAISMIIYNDTCSGEHPVLYTSPDGVGFGPGQ